MRIAFLTATVFLAASATAQNFYIPDNNAAAGTCNVIPFGSGVGSPFYQCKYQVKASAADLGNLVGVLITGLGFAPCNSGASSFTNLEIVMDHHPAGQPLSTTFASNLGQVAGFPPAVTVLDAPNYSWNTTAGNWVEIGLQEPFVYLGGDIVIQITTVDGTSPGGFHRGTQQRVSWFASSGTPPASGNSGNAAGKFEVSMLTAKLSTYGVGCAGTNGTPTHTLTGSSQPGNTVGLDLSNGLPNGAAFSVMGFYNGNLAFPLDLGSLGLPGCFQYHDVIAVLPVVLDGAGAISRPFAIPAGPGFVGTKIYSQYACVDPAANAGGFTTSGYGRIYIGN